MNVTPEQSEANAQAVAAAIRSIQLANLYSWVATAQLLENGGVVSREKFADVMGGLAKILDTNPDGAVGANMLREVHDLLRGINPPPRWQPEIVEGGKHR